jgi:glycosyltransferase involved in cell wall biosynthesis
MKICFLVELPLGMWQWDDGLRGAMQILEKEHEVCYHLDGLRHDHTPDLLMCWGGTLSKTYNEGLAYQGRKALFFAGGPRSEELFDQYDIVFFENDIHTREAKQWGNHYFTAFGTNTKIFYPMPWQPKVFDVIYPGAFGLWKRKEVFAEAVRGLKAFSLGNIQYHEPQCLDVCIQNGVAVSGDIPQNRLPYFMAMSKTVIVLPVPEIGCQRTVLEAMAMNIPVIVPDDAPLVVEFAEKGGGIIINPTRSEIKRAIIEAPQTNEKGIQYIKNEMTEQHYAQKIINAMKSIL